MSAYLIPKPSAPINYRKEFCFTIVHENKNYLPFSISTLKTCIFSIRFSNSYSADAENGSISSFRRLYSLGEYVGYT